jgi:hypothetical protein
MGAGRGGGRGRGGVETAKRAYRTLFFIIFMLGSLLISLMPLLVSIADITIPCTLLSTFTCCESCFSFRIDWSSYSFRSSLVDIPFVSLVRSVAAIYKCLASHYAFVCAIVAPPWFAVAPPQCSVLSFLELFACFMLQVLTFGARYRAFAMGITLVSL